MTSSPSPIACALSQKDASAQALEWTELEQHSLGIDPLPNGVRIHIPIERLAALEDLAARESSCCAFLDIVVTAASDRATVEVTSDNPDALPLISRVAGIPLL